MGRFHFIDVLSSHYMKMESSDNCTYLDSPVNLADIRNEITKAIKEKKCSVVVFDSISNMLEYREKFDIIRFTHDLLSQKTGKNKILYIILKNGIVPAEENENLVKDLIMFADKAIDLISA